MSGLQDLRNPFSTAFLVALIFAVLAFIIAVTLTFLNTNDLAVPDNYFSKFYLIANFQKK